jgi:hypothetical protein
MVPWIKGKEGLDRRLSFCAGAKICSGKAKTLDEAKQICNERFNKKRREDLHLTVDDLAVKLNGKEITISADIMNKLCGCKRK